MKPKLLSRANAVNKLALTTFERLFGPIEIALRRKNIPDAYLTRGPVENAPNEPHNGLEGCATEVASQSEGCRPKAPTSAR